MRLLIALLAVPLLAQTGVRTPVDPDIATILAARGTARILVALKQPDPEAPLPLSDLAARIRAEIDPGLMQVKATFRFVPAVIAEVQSAAALDALAAHPAVAAIELDGGGYGYFAPPVAVVKVARATIFDSGLPDSPSLSDAAKLAGEACFCWSANGQACCPSGAKEETGENSARQSPGFPTTSHAWLRLPEGGAPDPNAVPVVDWNPFVTSVKTLNERDRFETWEPIFAALDWFGEWSETNHQDVVLFSFASAKLYGPEACSASSASATIWASIIVGLAARHVDVLTPNARGGPGPASGLPGCLLAAGLPAREVGGSERLPLPQAPMGLGSSTPGLGAPRVPVAANASAANGRVVLVRPAGDGEIPPVDTAGDVSWKLVRVTVVQSQPLRPDAADFLQGGKTYEFLTTEAVDLLTPERGVKFSAVLTGDEGRSIWYATDWRIIDAPSGVPADAPRAGRPGPARPGASQRNHPPR